MKVTEWVVNQKELLAIGAIIGTLSVAGVVRSTGRVQEPTRPVVASVAQAGAPVSDSGVTMLRLSNDMANVSARLAGVNATVDALLRVECIGNTQKWATYELAGIHCSELVPSTVQAGRIRR